MNNTNSNSLNFNLSERELALILQILAIEKQNNISSKKYTKQEIVNKLLNIIRKEVENEIQENSFK